MPFQDFISSLSEKDKKNFEDYSKIRGEQQYRIIYETLVKIDSNVSWNDVNSFVIFDKAIKDTLFKYLGTLEELIRNDLIVRYDFALDSEYKEKEYHYFKSLPKCILKNQKPDEITDFYKYFSLNFGDMVSFIKEYDKAIGKYDVSKFDIIIDLRNGVMHHSPLLFNYNFESTSKETMEKIKVLISLLPDRYKTGEKGGIVNNLRCINNKTKENISKAYYKCLLFEKD